MSDKTDIYPDENVIKTAPLLSDQLLTEINLKIYETANNGGADYGSLKNLIELSRVYFNTFEAEEIIFEIQRKKKLEELIK